VIIYSKGIAYSDTPAFSSSPSNLFSLASGSKPGPSLQPPLRIRREKKKRVSAVYVYLRCPVKDTLGILRSRDRLEIQTTTEAAYNVLSANK